MVESRYKQSDGWLKACMSVLSDSPVHLQSNSLLVEEWSTGPGDCSLVSGEAQRFLRVDSENGKQCCKGQAQQLIQEEKEKKGEGGGEKDIYTVSFVIRVVCAITC